MFLVTPIVLTARTASLMNINPQGLVVLVKWFVLFLTTRVAPAVKYQMWLFAVEFQYESKRMHNLCVLSAEASVDEFECQRWYTIARLIRRFQIEKKSSGSYHGWIVDVIYFSMIWTTRTGIMEPSLIEQFEIRRVFIFTMRKILFGFLCYLLTRFVEFKY